MPKMSIWVYFKGLGMENVGRFYCRLVYFEGIWNILWLFGIFTVIIWYILWSFRILFPFWYVVQKKSGSSASKSHSSSMLGFCGQQLKNKNSSFIYEKRVLMKLGFFQQWAQKFARDT
jgi:hypothetical protein